MFRHRCLCLASVMFLCSVGLSVSQKFCKGPFVFERHNADCRAYRIRICSSNMKVNMPGCQEGAVFSTVARTCVREGSLYDDCPKQSPASDIAPFAAPMDHAPDTIEDRCRRGEGPIFPHPTECGLFYNCNKLYDEVPDDFEQYMDECKYPLLFNGRTGRCDDFRNVQCGAKAEPKNPCDYRINWCRTSHCVPCKLRFPDCDGASDGLNPFPSREWTPNFIQCNGGRLVGTSACPPGQDFPNLFSPRSHQCESIRDVPVQFHGGEIPDCKGQEDGHYKDRGGKCDTFFVCTSEVIEGTYKCPVGSVFDDHALRCVDPSEVCGACGTLTLNC